MASDSDDMWKRGFDGDFVTPPATDVPPPPPTERRTPGATDLITPAAPAVGANIEFSLPGGDRAERDEPAQRNRWRPRLILAGVALLAVAAAASAVIDTFGDDGVDRPDFDEIVGADPRRLPQQPDLLWSTAVDGFGAALGDVDESNLIVDGRDIAIGHLEDPTEQQSTLVGLDAQTGDVRWRTTLPYDTSGGRFLGVIDAMLIVEQLDTTDRRLFGISTADGSTVWELDTADNGVHVVLHGTKIVTRVSFTGNERLTFIDPIDGAEVGRIEGRLTSSDLLGTWFVKNNRRVVSVDLSNGFTDPVEFAASGSNWDEPAAVVDGRIIVVESDGTLSEAVPDEVERRSLVAVGGNLPNIASLVHTGGPTFAIIGDGEVLGARLVDDDVQIQWTTPGSVRGFGVTGRGLLFSVRNAADGTGDTITVIDAVTGATVSMMPAPRDDNDLPQLIGDGFVSVDDAELGSELVGHDLDGVEQWRLPSGAPFRIGDRIIVTISPSGDGYAFTAYGDAE